MSAAIPEDLKGQYLMALASLCHFDDPEPKQVMAFIERIANLETENAALRQRVEARTNERNVAMEVLTRIGTPENIHEATSAILAARKDAKEAKR
jgi:hypothetical protein